jgi:hypothetical protein
MEVWCKEIEEAIPRLVRLSRSEIYQQVSRPKGPGALKIYYLMEKSKHKTGLITFKPAAATSGDCLEYMYHLIYQFPSRYPFATGSGRKELISYPQECVRIPAMVKLLDMNSIMSSPHGDFELSVPFALMSSTLTIYARKLLESFEDAEFDNIEFLSTILMLACVMSIPGFVTLTDTSLKLLPKEAIMEISEEPESLIKLGDICKDALCVSQSKFSPYGDETHPSWTWNEDTYQKIKVMYTGLWSIFGVGANIP